MDKTARFEDYTIDLVQEEDGSYFAEVVELNGCLAAGDDPNDAVEMLRGSFEIWMEEAVQRGRPIPPPISLSPNGRMLLRLPRSLHVKVARAAARDGVSVNAFVATAVAERVGSLERPRP
jgi:antitoxin HicB